MRLGGLGTHLLVGRRLVGAVGEHELGGREDITLTENLRMIILISVVKHERNFS